MEPSSRNEPPCEGSLPPRAVPGQDRRLDPLTHGLLGASLAHVVAGAPARLGRLAALVGAGAGMLPDLDVLVPGYHRHFSHSFAFVPLGAALAAAPFLVTRRGRARARLVLAASALAYVSHPLLDAATSTGTLLLWPFSLARVAWDVVPIIDLFVTVPLLVGAAVGVVRRRLRPAAIGLALALAWLAFGAVQRERALAAQARLARARGDQIVRRKVLPMPLAVWLWRSLYVTADGRVVVDAVRLPFGGPPTARPGGSLPVYDPGPVLAGPAADRERLAAGLRRAAWHTGGFWAASPDEPGVLLDLRVATDPAALDGIWSVRIDPEDPRTPVRSLPTRSREGAYGALWREIVHGDPRHRPVP